jgi:hypothetical protein
MLNLVMVSDEESLFVIFRNVVFVRIVDELCLNVQGVLSFVNKAE